MKLKTTKNPFSKLSIPKNYTPKQIVSFVIKANKNGISKTQISKYLNDNDIPTVSTTMIELSEFDYIIRPKWSRFNIATIINTKQYNPTKKKYNAHTILTKLNEVHNNEYTYPNYTKYNSVSDKITVLCEKHGEFYPTISAHMNGTKCNKCVRESTPDKVIKKAQFIHKHFYTDYDFTGYTNSNSSNIRIKCPKHGWFTQNAGYHVRGGRCIQCIQDEQHIPHNEILRRANEIHNNYYEEYDLTEYTNIRSKIKIKCPKHGWFSQIVNSHIGGSGCPICKMSKGERKLMKHLDMNVWKHEFNLPNHLGKSTHPLRFDFYSQLHNTAIEYQGTQHYKPIERLGGQQTYEANVKRDNIKKQYCKLTGIKLICIHYKRFKHIEEILRKYNIHKDQALEDLGIDFI
jgi:hypothetical protein